MLICAVGTRGDVQPAIALALAAQELGGEARLCVSPNFVAWAAGLGFEARPMGVVMRAPRPGEPPPGPLPDLIGDQFAVVEDAAEGCDVIVGAGAHQYAARSVADARGVACEVAVYAPVALPSPELAPHGHRTLSEDPETNGRLWADYRRSWDERSLARVNANRARLGLAALEDGYGHILGDAPWLAADPVLGPAPATPGLSVVQTGAWMLRDESPLPAHVEAFLEAGEPPVYLGFGSMPAPGAVARTLIEAARAVGRRMILSAGWAELAPIDDAADCLAVGDLNHAALFARVAAVAHHGGAGTTAAAALAGAPQVVAPMFGDQFYWAERIKRLEIGAATPAAVLTVEALAEALEAALRPEVAERTRAVAARVTPDGAAAAARRLASA
jgi:vancomycin aglycone glucosyltransferase